MVGHGPDTQWGRKLLCNKDRGGVVEEGDSGCQLLPQHGHLIPRRAMRVTGMSQDGYRLPLGQTSSSVNFHEGGVLLRNLSGPAQGAQRLG